MTDKPDHSRLQRVLGAAQRVYDAVVATLSVVFMSVIVTTMGVQVFFRYVLNDSLIWAEELSSYMLVLISFLLLGAAFQRGEMMSIELVMGALTPRMRALASLPVSLAMAGFLILLSYYCYRFALLNQTATIPAIDFIMSSIVGETRTIVISRFWLYLTIPIGLLILAAHILGAAIVQLVAAFGSDGLGRSGESR